MHARVTSLSLQGKITYVKALKYPRFLPNKQPEKHWEHDNTENIVGDNMQATKGVELWTKNLFTCVVPAVSEAGFFTFFISRQDLHT